MAWSVWRAASTPPADMVGKGVSSGYGPDTIVYAGDYAFAPTKPAMWRRNGERATGEGT